MSLPERLDQVNLPQSASNLLLDLPNTGKEEEIGWSVSS